VVVVHLDDVPYEPAVRTAALAGERLAQVGIVKNIASIGNFAEPSK
jgi:hypothetical protein